MADLSDVALSDLESLTLFDGESGECARCRETYLLDDGAAPSAVCHSCAQEIVSDALPSLLAEVRRARASASPGAETVEQRVRESFRVEPYAGPQPTTEAKVEALGVLMRALVPMDRSQTCDFRLPRKVLADTYRMLSASARAPASSGKTGEPLPSDDVRCHDLKTWPEAFDGLWSRAKPYEIRKDDRGYEVGDCLHLREWVPGLPIRSDPERYTGRWINAVVTYKTPAGKWGIPAGLCVLGIRETARAAAPVSQGPAPSLDRCQACSVGVLDSRLGGMCGECSTGPAPGSPPVIASQGPEREEPRVSSRWEGKTLVWTINGEDVTDGELRAWCHINMPYPWNHVDVIRMNQVKAFAGRERGCRLHGASCEATCWGRNPAPSPASTPEPEKGGRS